MTELWEVMKNILPALIAAVPTVTALVVATVKIIRAIKNNSVISTKLDGIIDLMVLDYNSRKSVTPLEKQAMTELAQKIRKGGKIDNAMATAQLGKVVENLANTVSHLVANPAESSFEELTTTSHSLPEGFIDLTNIA